MSDDDWPWQVAVHAAEFFREEPLQSLLVDAVTAALSNVPGVKRAIQEDREVWVLQGQTSGEQLVHACSAALDGLAPVLRKARADR
jgi:hypothetical protein